MGGLPGCCLPEGLNVAAKQDEVFSRSVVKKPTNADMVGTLNLAMGVNDELAPCLRKDSNVLVLRDDRAPESSPPMSMRPAMDSCAMMCDLDFLTAPEWQTLPEAGPNALEDKLLQEAETTPEDAVYAVALRALWHNCPDALEVALRRAKDVPMAEAQAQDALFMAQKLEFTRIRQQYVAECIKFRSSGAPTQTSVAAFQCVAASIEARCSKLMDSQHDEQMTSLPGLITKRDTIMLQSRMTAITKQLVVGAKLAA
jgi:hypothetical protein|mmetsp:Transcript_116874/g.184867  ORF Transcript_116874/g.184867 Transcript_116874/m.184867 type:complete len:256 (+) Transcript_116874:94-861(+)